MLNKQRLLAPGPTPLPEEVRLALARDAMHHRKPPFKKVMAEVQEGLRMLFGTEQPVITLTSTGSGAMTAAVVNLFAPGEKVVVVRGGKFGERWGEISEQHGLAPVYIDVEWGEAVAPEQVREALDANPDARGVMVQSSETSTGVLHPVQGLAEITRERDVLLVVDGISAVGISPAEMDAWGVDCMLTGSQKGLMLPTGLAFICLSPRAWKRVETLDPKAYYFNLLGERAKTEDNQTLFSSATSLMCGLQESLRLFRETGMENVYRKQRALTALAREAVTAMGLELLAKENYTWGLTAVKLPEGIDGGKLLAVAAEKYGIILAGGQGRLKGRIVRLGHMGHVDWSDITAGLYALARSYEAVGGYIGSRDFMERGLAAYESALEEDA